MSLNVHRLPRRADFHFTALSRHDLARLNPSLSTERGIKRAAGHALAVARKEFGISLHSIDRHVGIVAAVVDPFLHPMLRHMPAWVITADIKSTGEGPATANTVYRRFCIVINLRTGKYRYAYTADPHPRTST